jgi:ABC-type Fe3+ transport system substrate-binding protein
MLAVAPAGAQDNVEILMYKGADRQQKLVEGAKKEGQLFFYSAMIANQALRPIAEAFMKKYPFVKVSYWRGDSEDILTKVLAEAKANNVVGDVVEGTGVGELAVQAKVVDRYFTPEISAYPEKYRDKDGQWTPTRLSYFGIAYNTNLVPAHQVPNSYEDLLKPEYKGKMAWRIGSSSGAPLFITNLWNAWGNEKAMAYLQKLKDQRIINFGSGSARTLVDRVVAGEYAIALQIFAHHPLISKAKGAPVDAKIFSPVATTAATMVIPKGIKHPHAALLLVDFLLSKDGQRILERADYIPAHPAVETSPNIAAIVPRLANLQENFISPETLIRLTESSEKIYQDLFR